jgi:hypothetical protein
MKHGLKIAGLIAGIALHSPPMPTTGWTSMLTDLILNILAPISAKRYPVVRTGLWLILAVFLVLLIYGVLAS